MDVKPVHVHAAFADGSIRISAAPSHFATESAAASAAMPHSAVVLVPAEVHFHDQSHDTPMMGLEAAAIAPVVILSAAWPRIRRAAKWAHSWRADPIRAP